MSDSYIICSYRIKQAIRFNILQKNPNNKFIIYEKIIYAVDIHRKAMKLVFTQLYNDIRT